MGRLQASEQAMPGRKPDLSSAAMGAMTAVMVEVGNTAIAWQSLRRLLDSQRGPATPIGAATGHSHAARYEGARKLLMNHSNVLRDITSPTPTSSPSLAPGRPADGDGHVAYEHSIYVEQFLRETVRRLLGCHEGYHELEESLTLSTPQQAMAWVQASRYLEARIKPHSVPLDKEAGASRWHKANQLLWRRLAPAAAESIKAVMAVSRQAAG